MHMTFCQGKNRKILRIDVYNDVQSLFNLNYASEEGQRGSEYIIPIIRLTAIQLIGTKLYDSMEIS